MILRQRTHSWLVSVTTVIVVWLGCRTPADAWGIEGHQATATLAEQQLSAIAKATVRELLGQSMASVAVWADDVKETTHQHTYNWHFVNIPSTADHYDPSRDCLPTARGDCIIAALERLEQDLGNVSLPAVRRREALMFIIHFVGDLHQPLHAINTNDDLGGNRRPIEAIGDATNLHAAWDSGIIRASGETTDDLVNNLNRATFGVDQSADALGTYTEWAMASFTIARTICYPQVDGDDRMTGAEREFAMSVIEDQIRLAGIRLAGVLNRVLGRSTPEARR